MIKLARPFFDAREKEAVARVLDSGWVMQGPVVAELESRIADYCGARYCVAVSSGTAALHVCFLALGIQPDDSVLIPSFAWPSAANITSLMGAIPVFVDAERVTYNLDCDHLRFQIDRAVEQGGHPSLIVPVHQFGVPCDMEKVLVLADEFNMRVLEDAACALGSCYNGKHTGTLGDVGIFSFHPRKVISTGEGGAIVTDDDDLAERCQALRNHGDLKRPGLNYRMTDVQAAIGLVQMDKLTEIHQKRAALLRTYVDLLGHQCGFSLPSYLTGDNDLFGNTVSLQTLMILLDLRINRDRVMAYMADREIEAKPGSVAGHLLAADRQETPDSGDPCPVSTQLHRQGLALPLHPGMTQQDVQRCVETLMEAVESESS